MFGNLSQPAATQPLSIFHFIALSVTGTGVDTFVQQLAAAQRRAGHFPVVSSDPADREALFASVEAVGARGCPAPARAKRRLALKLSTAWDMLRQVAFVRHHLRAGAADVCHLHVVGGEGLTAYLGAVLGCAPLVVTQHTMRSYIGAAPGPRARLTLELGRCLARRMVFSYEEGLEEYLREGLPRKRLATIPFCADEHLFTGAAAAPVDGAPFRALVSARLVPGKGHVELLEALSLLGPAAERFEVLFAGEGPERAAIEAEIARRKLGSRVRLLGLVGREQLPSLLASVHATVLPTHMMGETFPVSLLEAALVGLPAVGTRWFGIPDIIGHEESGLLVEPRDAAGLADALTRLSTDRALWARLSAGARLRGHQRFTAGRVAEQYDEVYREALAA